MPHVYLPDHNVNMVFLSSGTPGDWALGDFWGPLANETRAWLDHLATGRKACGARDGTGRALQSRKCTLAIQLRGGERSNGREAAAWPSKDDIGLIGSRSED